MKHLARVRSVLRAIHKEATVVDGKVTPIHDMPLPDRVEINYDERDGAYFMHRFTSAGDDCGDTWHETLDDAFEQAKVEYGLEPSDFLTVS